MVSRRKKDEKICDANFKNKKQIIFKRLKIKI